MLDLGLFSKRLQLHDHLGYTSDFEEFWKYKLRTETENAHILDDEFRSDTYQMLCRILPKWKTYRGVRGIKWKETLKDSLKNMSQAYYKVKSYSLLEFDDVPIESLNLIWHELGRIKERNGKRNPNGLYYVIAVTKPLMFVWGQTLAFDSNVRMHVASSFNVSRHKTRWSFEDWRKIMLKFQDALNKQPEDVAFIRQVSHEKFGEYFNVPYGQFLDLYYWD